MSGVICSTRRGTAARRPRRIPGAPAGEGRTRSGRCVGVAGIRPILALRRCRTTTQPPAAALNHLDQGAGPGRRGGPFRARHHTAVDGDGDALGIVPVGEARHQVGDGGPGRHLHRRAVDADREHRHAGARALSRAPLALGQQVDDGGRGQRCEQDAVAEVPVATATPSRAVQPMRGVLSGVAGRSPAPPQQLELVETGDDGPGIAQQLVPAPACTAGVVAALLDGGADDEGTVSARARGRRSAVHEAAHGRGSAGSGARRVGPEAQDACP